MKYYYNHIKEAKYNKLIFVINIVICIIPVLSLILLFILNYHDVKLYFVLLLLFIFLILSLLETSPTVFILYENKILIPTKIIVFKLVKQTPIPYKELKEVIINKNSFVFRRYNKKFIDYLPGHKVVNIEDNNKKEEIISYLLTKIPKNKLIYYNKK